MRGAQFVIFAALALGVSANIQCFQCNSNENSSCDVNDASALTAFKKACTPLSEGPYKGQNAVGCRKITQSVEGEETTVRECAYSGDNVDGLKKTGNFGIKLWYYQCENDSPATPCNSVGTIFSSFTFIAVALAFLSFH